MENEKTIELLTAILQKMDALHNDFLSLTDNGGYSIRDVTNSIDDICDKLNNVAANQVVIKNSISALGNCCDDSDACDEVDASLTEIKVSVR